MTETRKAPRRFGKIEQLKSGQYRAGYRDPQSKARHKPYIWAPQTFARKAPAEAWLDKVKASIDADTWMHPDAAEALKVAQQAEAERKRIRLGDYAAKWLQTRRNSKGQPLSPRTIAERERILRPAGEMHADHPGGPLADLVALVLADITAERVRDWYAAQQALGTVTQTSRAYELLKAILNTALEDGLIGKQPCTIKGGSTASTGVKSAPPANEKQFVKLLDAISDEYKALVVIGAASGCRYGEATDLRADDITVIKDKKDVVQYVEIHIDSAVVQVAGGYIQKPTKTGDERLVMVFGADADVIAEHVKKFTGRELLFKATKSDGPLPQSTFWKHFNKARITAGLPETRFHDLRHYAGTRYAQGGATLKEIMARLGHSTPAAAMRYQHSKDAERLAMLAASAGRKR